MVTRNKGTNTHPCTKFRCDTFVARSRNRTPQRAYKNNSNNPSPYTELTIHTRMRVARRAADFASLSGGNVYWVIFPVTFADVSRVESRCPKLYVVTTEISSSTNPATFTIPPRCLPI